MRVQLTIQQIVAKAIEHDRSNDAPPIAAAKKQHT
jgi:hypothetical protein